MDDRKKLARVLDLLEEEQRKLEISYEQYFAGIEKREPLKNREAMARKLRQFVNRRIIQTDLRFRCQNLATRFHTYGNHWDRIVRMIEEGRYHRGAGRIAPPLPSAAAAPATPRDPFENVYRDLVKAHQDIDGSRTPPGRDQVISFLQQQQEKIRAKFGERDIEFRVVTEDGKPKIKVRAKQ